MASAALTATGQQAGISLRLPTSTAGTNLGGTPRRGLKAKVYCTTVTGTTPSATFDIQHSDDNSTYAVIGTAIQGALTAAGEADIAFETDKPWVRLHYTISGTSPSFTTAAYIAIARP